FNVTVTSFIYTLSLHDALPIFNNLLNTSLVIADIYSSPTIKGLIPLFDLDNDKEKEQLFEETHEELRFFQETYKKNNVIPENFRSEEHTSELQSRENLVCRLLL